MSSSDTRTFEIDSQSGQYIANVGGDQTIYYGDGGRGGRGGKVLAALGLVLSLVGLAVLVLVAVATATSVFDAMHADDLHAPYTQYVAPAWPAAVGLIAAGFVVKRFARIVIGR